MENDLDKVSSGDCVWQSIVELTYNKIKISINNSPKTVIKNEYTRVLGVNPNNNKTLSVYIGQYGPVLKEENNSPGCKHRFISLKDELLDDITLEQAVGMLSYPRIIGTYNNIDILLDKGRYGLYIKYNSKNYSYKITDETNIDIDSLTTFIDIKSETQNKYGEFKKVNAKIKIMKGQYGPYIKYKSLNATIPEEKDPTEITMEEALILIEKRKEYDKIKGKNKKRKK
jgi:DNA topoisomerase-1